MYRMDLEHSMEIFVELRTLCPVRTTVANWCRCRWLSITPHIQRANMTRVGWRLTPHWWKLARLGMKLCRVQNGGSFTNQISAGSSSKITL